MVGKELGVIMKDTEREVSERGINGEKHGVDKREVSGRGVKRSEGVHSY